ncbi:MAG: MBL fold metallo-hydrolase [Anaerolineae bacterium]|nr:MBL fold metallo-hydrolase [Anaerolineae bacterium]
MEIQMIGHSTLLIESGGFNIITDPYFGTWGHIAYKRLSPPALSREQVKDVDLVLISHSHWDHIDGAYLRSLNENVPVLIPALSQAMARLLGAKRVIGVRAWQSHRFGDRITITVVPAVHVTFTVGFVIEDGEKSVYFAGDTFYSPSMSEIGKRFKLDAALMPVTTFRIPMTMGEKGAVRAVQALQPAAIIPIHLGVQPRSLLLRTNHTPQGFAQRVHEAGIETPVIILGKGESHTI